METTFFQVEPPTVVFSGTTMMSPGPSTELSTPPDHNPLLPLVTEPFARIIKIALLLASPVAPPARERYQPAFFPGEYAMAFELYTCPAITTKPGCFGISSESPARSSTSSGEPTKFFWPCRI